MACIEASNISAMKRASTGLPWASVTEKVQFSAFPGSSLSRNDSVLIFSLRSGRACRMVTWAVFISPSRTVSRLMVAMPPNDLSNLTDSVLQLLLSLSMRVSTRWSAV